MGPAGSCWCNHKKDTRCNKHKSKADCLNNYNHKAGGPGISMLEQICGWSINTDKFGGQDSGNCRSKPFIQRKKWVPIADFGACQSAVEEDSGQEGPDGAGGEVPTMPPTCAECSTHNDNKKACYRANEDITPYCVDACIWNKKNDQCEDFECSQFTEDGMIKCEKKSKKIFAKDELEKSAKYKSMCYFNVKSEQCQASIPDVECRDYNRDGLKKKKKACKKLPKYQGKKCVYDKHSKQCRGENQNTDCTKVRNSRTCERKLAHCSYDILTKSCKQK